MKYKVGDKVKIKNHVLGCCAKDDCMGFVAEMKDFVGKKLKVRDVESGIYLLEDGHGAAYSNCMIEPSGSKKSKKTVKKSKKSMKVSFTKTDHYEYITLNGDLYQKVSSI